MIHGRWRLGAGAGGGAYGAGAYGLAAGAAYGLATGGAGGVPNADAAAGGAQFDTGVVGPDAAGGPGLA